MIKSHYRYIFNMDHSRSWIERSYDLEIKQTLYIGRFYFFKDSMSENKVA